MRILAYLLLSVVFAHPSVLRAAENYLIIDNETGTILDGKDPNEKVQVASLTKIATAMVVLDWAELNKESLAQLATVPPQAVSIGGANPVGLTAGDQVSLRDLLYCALLASDNIAAITLAHHVGTRLPNAEGLNPVGNFTAHMNALARKLNMKRTRFLNPAGLDNSEEALPFSTAADLARLTRYGYFNSDFAFFVDQKTRQIHIFRAGVDTPFELRNTNELLGVEGIDGVKTGRTARAGDCVILSSERETEARREGETVFITPRRIIVVVLNSRDRFGEGLALIRRGWTLYDQWAADGRKVKGNQAL